MTVSEAYVLCSLSTLWYLYSEVSVLCSTCTLLYLYSAVSILFSICTLKYSTVLVLLSICVLCSTQTMQYSAISVLFSICTPKYSAVLALWNIYTLQYSEASVLCSTLQYLYSAVLVLYYEGLDEAICVPLQVEVWTVPSDGPIRTICQCDITNVSVVMHSGALCTVKIIFYLFGVFCHLYFFHSDLWPLCCLM